MVDRPSLHARALVASRVCTTIVLGLILSANLPALVHLAATPHAFCIEHQQIVDQPDPTSADLQPAPSSAARDVATLARGVPIRSAAHDHCEQSELAGRQFTLSAAVVSSSMTLPQSTLMGSGPAVPVCARGELYRLAPKTSPPELLPR
ncbi:MAG: hypothetical protein ABIJ09_27355 [Pseudomonadota bacterium]